MSCDQYKRRCESPLTSMLRSRRLPMWCWYRMTSDGARSHSQRRERRRAHVHCCWVDRPRPLRQLLSKRWPCSSSSRRPPQINTVYCRPTAPSESCTDWLIHSASARLWVCDWINDQAIVQTAAVAAAAAAASWISYWPAVDGLLDEK